MTLTFVQLSAFVAKWRRMGLTDEDLQALEELIMERPRAGQVMRGSGGLRKIRFAPPSWHTGKSGATRVCYVVFSDRGLLPFHALCKKRETQSVER